jgi:serine/threonine protein phosphatase PrpC
VSVLLARQTLLVLAAALLVLGVTLIVVGRVRRARRRSLEAEADRPGDDRARVIGRTELPDPPVEVRPPPAPDTQPDTQPDAPTATSPSPWPSHVGWLHLSENGQAGTEQPGDPVLPDRTVNGSTWAARHDAGGWALALWRENLPGRGEDAPPTVLYSPVRGCGLLAVYDGLGGAGSAKLVGADGSERTESYVASRLARSVVEEWFEAPDDDPSGPDAERRLHDALEARFQAVARDLPSESRLVGSMRRRLPTTLAALGFERISQQQEPETYAVDAIWSGDSRCFLLSARYGLQQVTVDDSDERDAFMQLERDPPLTNVISADRPFTIHRRRIWLREPGVLIAATDGCFGYVATPAHFEHYLLSTLAASGSAGDWAGRLLDELSAIAQDDVSLTLGCLGYSSFGQLRSALHRRTEYMRRQHWAPVVDADPTPGGGGLLERRRASWADYRDLYMALVTDKDARS